MIMWKEIYLKYEKLKLKEGWKDEIFTLLNEYPEKDAYYFYTLLKFVKDVAVEEEWRKRILNLLVKLSKEFPDLLIGVVLRENILSLFTKENIVKLLLKILKNSRQESIKYLECIKNFKQFLVYNRKNPQMGKNT